MAKPRVHELAKELDPTGKKITSKMILAWLKDQGEFVKAASSAVEPPVARRVREHFAAKPGGTAGGRGKDGAKPGEMAVESQKETKLIINAKAAKAMGVEIPQSLRDQADQVIE